MDRQPDIFYVNPKLTKKAWVNLFKEAKELSYDVRIDGLLDSWTRKPINLTYDQIITCFEKTLKRHLHITFIHRMSRWKAEKDYLSIGFCTLIRKYRFLEIDPIEQDHYGDLFLWIEVDIEHKEKFLKKYKLVAR